MLLEKKKSEALDISAYTSHYFQRINLYEINNQKTGSYHELRSEFQKKMVFTLCMIYINSKTSIS